MMDNSEWIPPIGDAVDQNPISFSETDFGDQLSTPSPPLTTTIQPQKRQRKPRQPKKSDLQPNGSSTSSESTSPLLDIKPVPDYRPNLGHLYRHPTQWSQFYGNQHLLAPQNQHHLFTQSTQMPALHHMHTNPWLPFPLSTAATSYPYNQFSQQRLATPTMPNLTAFYRNQGLSLPSSAAAAVPSQMNPQSSYGFNGSEPRSPRYGINYSPTYPENAQNPQYYQGGTVSAFQPFKRSATGETDEVIDTSNKKSKISHYNYDTVPQSTHSPIGNNDTTKESAVNILMTYSQMDNGKVVEPAAVIDEKYDFSCVICQETRKDTVLMPCRHLCVCEKCSVTIELCPLCREVFNDTMTVFT